MVYVTVIATQTVATQGQYTEVTVGYADSDEIVFASYFVQTPSNISRLSLKTGKATTVDVNPPIGNAGGATRYKGQVTWFRDKCMHA